MSHVMGDLAKERRDRQLMLLLGENRLEEVAALGVSGRPGNPLLVCSSFAKIHSRLQTIQLTLNPTIPAWRELSPWMRIQLAHLTLCEWDCRAFTLHISPWLLAELDRQPSKLEFMRRRLTPELKAINREAVFS